MAFTYIPKDPHDILEEEMHARTFSRVLIFLCLCICGGLVLYKLFVLPPAAFPVETTIVVEKGETLKDISRKLESAKVISSHTAFETIVIYGGKDRAILPGEYKFTHPLSVFGVAERFIGGVFGISKIKITIPEGYTRIQMASLFAQKFPNVSKDTFLQMTEGKEGYLFPDTYFFFPSVTTEVVVQTLSDTFTKKTETLFVEARERGMPISTLVTLASIVEREANGKEDRGIIAGILWNRLNQGILLQVDAPFVFLLGKESKNLTRDDLAIDSPYNTYKYKGLPPTPIASPGLDALRATLSPTPNTYLFYLHGQDGAVYYAHTFAEHIKNKKNYLR